MSKQDKTNESIGCSKTKNHFNWLLSCQNIAISQEGTGKHYAITLSKIMTNSCRERHKITKKVHRRLQNHCHCWPVSDVQNSSLKSIGVLEGGIIPRVF
jgi:hypothetical protein